MRAFAWGSAFVTWASVLACQTCTDEGPRPHPVFDQPLGARCEGLGDCAAGLTCIGRTCTVDCAGGPGVCPAGSSCIVGQTCLPACASDADCLLGSTVGTCAASSSPPYCIHVSCRDDSACPPQGRCVGRVRTGGIAWNEYCEDGFCQR